MKLIQARVRGFRRLEDASIDFEQTETVFVGPNNSGKTSATDVFRLFLKAGDFSIHDYSVSRVSDFDRYGRDEISEGELPKIELDLWFSIDPDTEFGRVGLLLPDTEQDFEKVGIRLSYLVNDAQTLKANYLTRLTSQPGGTPKKPLSYYLSLPGTLRQHCAIAYYALDPQSEDIQKPLGADEGRHVLKSLLRVEFVDAQRKFDDHEHSGSTRLSKVLTGFYKRNLKQPQMADAATEIIDRHNADLTGHYQTVFAHLLGVIQGLGVPSVNDRSLRVTSSLVAEAVLQSNTTLTYVDNTRGHELPESYNGLGFKNLIYLAVQLCEFHHSWMKTDKDRPMTMVIFIEEPEAHLHAQAQQAFIANAWRIIQNAYNEEPNTPQLVVTTHSSHILDTVDFAHVRYFRRSHCSGDDPRSTPTLNASTVLNLRRFKPSPGLSNADPNATHRLNGSNGQANPNTDSAERQETLDFLKRYLRLTHCDLFFADAAVLVEGPVEKLLLPQMIEKEASSLQKCYLTVLDVGGAFAHRFAGLIEFLAIPYLVISDIDSVDPAQNRSTCRADTPGAVSSNPTLKFFLDKSAIGDLLALDATAQHLVDRRCYITFQRQSLVEGYPDSPMHGRTFEDTFAYENVSLFRDGTLNLGHTWTTDRHHEGEYEDVYERVKSSSFKKIAFALSIASCKATWKTPGYIAEGLRWLENELQASELASGLEADV